MTKGFARSNIFCLNLTTRSARFSLTSEFQTFTFRQRGKNVDDDFLDTPIQTVRVRRLAELKKRFANADAAMEAGDYALVLVMAGDKEPLASENMVSYTGIPSFFYNTCLYLTLIQGKAKIFHMRNDSSVNLEVRI